MPLVIPTCLLATVITLTDVPPAHPDRRLDVATSPASPSAPATASVAAERCIVEAPDLPAEIAAAGDNLVILDVRTKSAFEQGHLPGAALLSYDDWKALSMAESTGLDHAQTWHGRIGSLGIDANDTVIIYDDGKMTEAARVWFVLQHFGVARAAVVNGGFPRIAELQDQLKLATDPTPSPRPAVFSPSESAAATIGLMDRQQVKLAIERNEAQILDARTPEEFRGQDLRKNSRGGHLPTAVNIPHATLLDKHNCLKPAAELGAMLEQAGFVKGRPVISHCDGGGRAALAALAAARAGYGPVLNYYLSFGDWAKDATCPVVTSE